MSINAGHPHAGAEKGLTSNKTLRAYGAAVVLPALTLLLRLAFWEYLPGYPFVAFIPSAAAAAVLGGVGPSVVAATLSAALALGFLADPPGFMPSNRQAWVGLLFYSLDCAILIAMIDRTSRASGRAADAAQAEAAARENALQARLELAERAAAQGAAEKNLELVTDALPVLIAAIGRDLRYKFANRAYEEWFGLDRELVRGHHISEVVGPEVFERLKPHIETVLSGSPTSFEERIVRANGSHRDIYAQYVPYFGTSGQVEGYFALTQDLTKVKQQADLLSRQERHTGAILDSVTDCFYAVDHEWRITLFNRAAERYYGRGREEVLGRKLWEAFPAHLNSVYEQHQQRVMEKRVPVTVEARSVVFPDRYIEMRISPQENGGLTVSFSDVTSRKAQEHQRELLVNELNHRVKNTLAIVQSIAAQSLRLPNVPQEARAAFEGRIMALAAAHDLLTKESWEAAEIRTVAEAALQIFDLEHRFEVTGPDLRIRPHAAVSLTLALHELATNATKYGALSNKTGMVSVTWAFLDGETPTFRLVWQERGGPEVATPPRSGFGSRLIEKGLAGDLGGQVSLGFPPDGVVCTIEAPVVNLKAG